MKLLSSLPSAGATNKKKWGRNRSCILSCLHLLSAIFLEHFFYSVLLFWPVCDCNLQRPTSVHFLSYSYILRLQLDSSTSFVWTNELELVRDLGASEKPLDNTTDTKKIAEKALRIYTKSGEKDFFFILLHFNLSSFLWMAMSCVKCDMSVLVGRFVAYKIERQ